MNRRNFIRGTSAAALAAIGVSGVATASIAAPVGGGGDLLVVADCNCEGTYEACCVDGPCDCDVQRLE